MKNYSIMGAGILLALASSARADVVTVKNTFPWDTKISDLIVWAEDGTQEIILKPGTDAAGSADDDVIKEGESRVYVTSKKVKKYFLSFKGVGVGEGEWKNGGDVSIIGSTAMLVDPLQERALCCSVNLGDGIVAPPPPPGAQFVVTNGQTPALPGWFIGTNPDFAGGEIFGPYTGPMVVQQERLQSCVLHSCASDLDGDLHIDGADVGLLLLDYGGYSPQSDLNGDGEIDGGDLGLLLLDFGDCCATCDACLDYWGPD
ncbi:MAG: hypothetical protein K8R92_11945 [Planctomycetes bacterium]|nr:hypothetical protein [Planctomycetota bacterium]